MTHDAGSRKRTEIFLTFKFHGRTPSFYSRLIRKTQTSTYISHQKRCMKRYR